MRGHLRNKNSPRRPTLADKVVNRSPHRDLLLPKGQRVKDPEILWAETCEGRARKVSWVYLV